MKIKVLHVINDLKMGGVCTVLFNILKNCNSKQYSYEILNLSGFEDSEMKILYNSLEIKRYNLAYKFEEGYSLFHQFKKAFFKKSYLYENRQTIKFIENLNPDILHFHTLPRELMLGRGIQTKTSCKLVFTDHSKRVNKAELNFFSKLLIDFPFRSFYRSYNVIAVSKSVESYIKDLGIDKVLESLTVVNNKIPYNDYRIDYITKSQLNIVYVSRISLTKGHDDLIKAWALLPSLNLTLHIVGADELGNKVQNSVASFKMNNKIVFTGPRNDVAEFLKKNDIGVFPSHLEGLPIALLEMMQVGLPCIVSDIDEIKSIVSDYVNCIQFKCGDSRQLSNKIIELVKDRELREKIGKAAANLTEKHYSQQKLSLTEEYEIVYNEILAKGL